MSKVDEVYQYYLEHKDLAAFEIAKACNVSRSVVTNAKKKYGFETVKRWKYSIGQELGPYKLKLLKHLGHGKGLFECSECHEPFKAEYCAVLTGRHYTCGCGHSRVKDLKGKRFGRLVVLEFTGETTEQGNALWKCRCDCGNIAVVSAGKLTSYAVQSCGCLRHTHQKETNHGLILKLSGKRFGKLVALFRFRKDGMFYYRCLCDCGREADVRVSSLINGNTQSCGCLKSKGEKRIADWLIENHIKFEKEKEFSDCINPQTGWRLRFDFYLSKYRCCLEYDGRQHVEGWIYHRDRKESALTIQKRDEVKNQYCLSHNIPLYRISYLEYNNIENRLSEILEELDNGST